MVMVGCINGDGVAGCGVRVFVVADRGLVLLLLFLEGVLVYGLRRNWYFVLARMSWVGVDHGKNMVVVSIIVRSSVSWSAGA